MGGKRVRERQERDKARVTPRELSVGRVAIVAILISRGDSPLRCGWIRWRKKERKKPPQGKLRSGGEPPLNYHCSACCFAWLLVRFVVLTHLDHSQSCQSSGKGDFKIECEHC